MDSDQAVNCRTFHASRLQGRRRPGGFTLVEVLVALAIMAVLAGMAWQGIDGIARSRTLSNESMERTLRLNTALAQWEHDLLAVRPTLNLPALRFDGANLRMTRETDQGMQVVVWTLRDGSWWRWAAPPVTRAAELQAQWQRSQQLLGTEPGTLRVLEGTTYWQVYFFRNDAWTNAQSSGDLVTPSPAAPPAPAASGAGAPGPAVAPEEKLPGGVRSLLTLGEATLMRDIVLAPQMP